MDTDSLYLALAEKEMEDCIRPEMKAERERLRWKDCADSFIADAVAIFFHGKAVTSTKTRTRESLDSSKRNSDAQRSHDNVAKLTADKIVAAPLRGLCRVAA